MSRLEVRLTVEVKYSQGIASPLIDDTDAVFIVPHLAHSDNAPCAERFFTIWPMCVQKTNIPKMTRTS